MYKKIYYSNVKDINDNNIKVEIYKNTEDVVVAKELLLANDGIEIKYDNGNNIFKTLIQSNCSITFLLPSIEYDLYSSMKNDVICKIYKNDSLVYFGIITNNIYNSEYETDLDSITIEFVDIIASLENYKYTSTNTIISFYQAIKKMLSEVDIDSTINTIYLHNVYTHNSNNDLLKNMYIQEKNFFDEKNEGLNYKDILSNIMQYLNLSLIQYEDSIYMFDATELKDTNTFIQYNLNDDTVSTTTLTSNLRAVEDIKVYSSSASISMQDTYNTINVIVNTLTDENTLPDLLYDSNWANQNSDPNKYYEYTDSDNVYLSAYFKQDIWTVAQSEVGDMVTTPIDEITNENIEELYSGSFFQKNDSYAIEDGEPSSLNWRDIFTAVACSKDFAFPKTDYLMLSTDIDYVIYKGGYFIFNLQYMFSNYHNANNTSIDTDVVYSNTKFSTGFDDTKFYCKLKIGDYYWNGEQWLNWNTAYLPNKELYENASFGTEYSNGVTKYYYIYQGSDKIYITEEEYNKMQARDRFWLVHKNKENDLIYNTFKQLTNQVSYKMNIANSEDGVLIPLPPNKVMYGKLEFELYTPYELGRTANYRTDGSAGENNTYVRYCHIDDMKMIYTNNNSYYDIFNLQEYECDIKFSNVIDDSFVKELDDIVMKVNTYNDKAASYSYVLYKITDGYNFVDKLKKGSESMIAEEYTINKYCDYYSTPKLVYNNNLWYNFNIIDRLSLMNKEFIINTMTIHILNNNAEITAMQLK